MNLETAGTSVAARLGQLDWDGLNNSLDERGWAILPQLLEAVHCRDTAALFDDESNFRRHIVMQQHGYGRGDYRYFADPLPPLVAMLRSSLYSRLAGTANRWYESMRIDTRFPAEHGDLLRRCHEAGQRKPTPLLLRYREGDYNALHQDLYGAHLFPIQVAVLLSEPEEEFSGGEFVLTEQRPRMQSRATVVPLRRGDAVAFAVRERPARGARGIHRVTMRHGVSVLRRGERFTLGIIFHDAE